MKRRDARRLALGSILKLWREHVRKVSQKTLERAVHLSAGRVTKLERGRSEPTPEEMDRIAAYFNTNAARWEELARPLEDDLMQRQNRLSPDGDYPPAIVDPSRIVDGDHAELGLTPELATRWRKLRADEQRVRETRDRLELETSRHLIQTELGHT